MIKGQLLKLIIKLLILAAIIAASDFVIGLMFTELLKNSKDGRYFKMEYSLDQSHEEVIILGSSRGEVNYYPLIIENKLKMTCWNASRGGQTIPYILAVQREVLRRYAPKLMIINIDPAILQEPLDYDKLSILRPFAKTHPMIYEMLSKKDWVEKYKLMSHIYDYNSILFYFIRPFFLKNKDGDPKDKGWKPRIGTISDVQIGEGDDAIISEQYIHLDSTRLDMFHQLINNAKQKNVKLIFVTSPNYYPIKNDTPTMTYIKQFHEEGGYKVLDFSNDTNLVMKKGYFRDIHHMNDVGAKRFTSVLADSLSTILRK